MKTIYIYKDPFLFKTRNTDTSYNDTTSYYNNHLMMNHDQAHKKFRSLEVRTINCRFLIKFKIKLYCIDIERMTLANTKWSRYKIGKNLIASQWCWPLSIVLLHGKITTIVAAISSILLLICTQFRNLLLHLLVWRMTPQEAHQK